MHSVSLVEFLTDVTVARQEERMRVIYIGIGGTSAVCTQKSDEQRGSRACTVEQGASEVLCQLLT